MKLSMNLIAENKMQEYILIQREFNIIMHTICMG